MFRIGVSRDSLNISCVFWLHNVLRSMFSDVSIYEHGRWLGCWGSQIVAEGVKFKLQVSNQIKYLKLLLGMRIWNFVNFESLIYMKLYNILILNKIQRCKKNNVEALKKTKQALFPRCILSCKQVWLQHTTIWTSNTYHIVTSIAAALNCCGNGLIRGVTPQPRMSAQRWADGINMWPNVVGTFKRPSAGVLVYKKFVWITVGCITMWVKNIFLNLKTLKK